MPCEGQLGSCVIFSMPRQRAGENSTGWAEASFAYNKDNYRAKDLKCRKVDLEARQARMAIQTRILPSFLQQITSSLRKQRGHQQNIPNGRSCDGFSRTSS